ncbi:hypothetical protein PG993_002587 [Apiospora rasikravindrae]|uniref:Uncharacterized protein n=1 Tax=Apiospora rasikravindrae TaxID=990691 RepID=A0ABR1TXH0_9PEZI
MAPAETTLRCDMWEVVTEKWTVQHGRAHAMKESVPFGHELLPQSLAPSFVKRDPASSQCTITTYLTRNINGRRVTIEKRTEYTSPDWHVLDQSQLASYKYSAAGTAISLIADTRNLVNAQVVPRAVVCLRVIRDIISRHWEKILGCFIVVIGTFFAVFVPCLYASRTVPDYILDRSIAINTEVASILRNASAVDLQLGRMIYEADSVRTLQEHILFSGLTRKTDVVSSILLGKEIMKKLGQEIDSFGFQLQWMGVELHSAYDDALFHLRRRPELPRSTWHRWLLQTKQPTMKELRQGLVSETLMHEGRLDFRRDSADSIGKHLGELGRHLENAEIALTHSKQRQEDVLQSMHNKTWSGSWRARFSDLPADAVARDIETAEAVLAQIRALRAFAAGIPAGVVQDDMRRALYCLRGLGDADPALRLKVWFMADFTAEQEAGMRRVRELTAGFDAKSHAAWIDVPSESGWRR